MTLAVLMLLAITAVPAVALSRSWWVVGVYGILAAVCWFSPELALSGALSLGAAFALVRASGGSL